ncbi:hypothetical protein C8J57DRAFT_1366443 [Mycena rebaudengoi]|nr:hypothetical protein C8J57DRAFT_1366443 [Mycena rebaudengoi]
MSLSWPTPRRPACYSAPPHDTTAASLRAHGTMVSYCRSPPRRLGATSRAPIAEVPTLHARGIADAACAPGRISGMQRSHVHATASRIHAHAGEIADGANVGGSVSSRTPAHQSQPCSFPPRNRQTRLPCAAAHDCARLASTNRARAQGVMSLWFVVRRRAAAIHHSVETETPMLAHLKNAHSTSSCQDVTDRMYVPWRCSAVSSSMFNSPYHII